MDPELKQLLEENLRVSQENNVMLRAMRRNARWNLLGKVLFWVLLVIAPTIFLWGYLGPLMNAVNGGTGTPSTSTDFQNLINQYKAQ